MINKFPLIVQFLIYSIIFYFLSLMAYEFYYMEVEQHNLVHPKTALFAFLLLFTSIAGNYYNLRKPIREWFIAKNKNIYIQELFRFLVILDIFVIIFDIIGFLKYFIIYTVRKII